MTGSGIAAVAAQVAVVAVGAPVVTGIMRQIRSRMEGRAGAGVLQPWRDLRKLLGKQPITPVGAGPAFRAAPVALFVLTVLIAALVPLAATATPVARHGDMIVVVALLAAGTVALALAALDTGTAFGGMGASREMTVLALVEPTVLMAVAALSIRAGTTNLAAIVEAGHANPARLASPGALLAAVALVLVTIAETGRLPVDNPATHLELTMIHEAMVLEYSGPDLALIEWASSMRLTVLLGLIASLFTPWGIATTGGAAALAVGVAAFAGKVALAGGALAGMEVFMAKIRLFRVPELLAASFLFALLAVASSYFLA